MEHSGSNSAMNNFDSVGGTKSPVEQLSSCAT